MATIAKNSKGELEEIEVGTVVCAYGELITMTVIAIKGDMITCFWLDGDLNPMTFDLPAAAVWVTIPPSDAEEDDADE